MKRVIYSGREAGYPVEHYPPTLAVAYDDEADTVLFRARDHAVVHFHENGAHYEPGAEHEIEISRSSAAALMDALRRLPGPRVELPGEDVVFIGNKRGV